MAVADSLPCLPLPAVIGSLMTPEAPGARTAAGANGTGGNGAPGMMLPPAPLLPHATSSLASVSSSLGTGPSCSTSRVSTAAPQALDAAAAAAAAAAASPPPAASADAAAGANNALLTCSTLNTIPSYLTAGPGSVLAPTDSAVSSGTAIAAPSAASTANGSAPSSSGAGQAAAGPTGSDRGGSAGSGVGSGAGGGAGGAGGGGLLPGVASAASSCSLIAQRLGTEASLADRYRCAAALWELDFTELGEEGGEAGRGRPRHRRRATVPAWGARWDLACLGVRVAA